MAMTLTSDEHDDIRLQIGGDIDEEDLPDRRIDSEGVLGAAESYVLRRIPGGQNGLSAPNTRAYRRAVTKRCAWILVPSFPEKIQEAEGPFSVRHQATTVEKRQEILQIQIDEDIQRLVDAGHGEAVDEDEFEPAVAVFTVN